jgi:YesN/AraC family two-component response regulator
VHATVPDVVVTDIRMPPSGDDEGIVFAKRLRETHPQIGVVVVSQYAEPPAATAKTAAIRCSRSRKRSLSR